MIVLIYLHFNECHNSPRRNTQMLLTDTYHIRVHSDYIQTQCCKTSE